MEAVHSYDTQSTDGHYPHKLHMLLCSLSGPNSEKIDVELIPFAATLIDRDLDEK